MTCLCCICSCGFVAWLPSAQLLEELNMKTGLWGIVKDQEEETEVLNAFPIWRERETWLGGGGCWLKAELTAWRGNYSVEGQEVKRKFVLGCSC